MNLGNDVLACVSARVPYSGVWEALRDREGGGLPVHFFHCQSSTATPSGLRPGVARWVWATGIAGILFVAVSLPEGPLAVWCMPDPGMRSTFCVAHHVWSL